MCGLMRRVGPFDLTEEEDVGVGGIGRSGERLGGVLADKARRKDNVAKTNILETASCTMA